MCHAWTYPADPEQRGLGRLRRAHCLREKEQMLGKSAGEVDEDSWGNNAVFVTLQISLLPVDPDSFHVHVVGFLLIQLLLKNLRTISRQRLVRSDPEEQKLHCRICALPGIAGSAPLFVHTTAFHSLSSIYLVLRPWPGAPCLQQSFPVCYSLLQQQQLEKV